MRRPICFSVAAVAAAAASTVAGTLAVQPTSDSPLAPPPNGLRGAEPSRFVIAGATVHLAPGRAIERAQVNIDGDRFGFVGALSGEVVVEPGQRVHDYAGMHVYPGFLDAFVPVDAPKPDPAAPTSHWNSRVTPERHALAGSGLGGSESKALRERGFAAAGVHPDDGILRGHSAVVSTAAPFPDESMGRPPVHQRDAGFALAFERSGWNSSAYPRSHMGVVALIRQAYLDAAHRRDAEPAEPSSLDALDPAGPSFFSTSNILETMLAHKTWAELGHDNLVVVGHGQEFRRLRAIADAGWPVVVPPASVDKPDVTSVGAADSVALERLMAWEQAPTNLRRLADAGLTVAVTTSKMPRGQKFWPNLRRAVEQGGLDPDDALAMLTTNPAKILGLDDRLGSVAPGKHANLVVTDKPIFEQGAKIIDVWIDGRRHPIHDRADDAFDGHWNIIVAGARVGTLTIDGTRVVVDRDTPEEAKAREVAIDPPNISFVFDPVDPDQGTSQAPMIVSGVLSRDRIIGTGRDPIGDTFQWSADRGQTPADADAEPAETADAADAPGVPDVPDVPDLPGYPFGPYAVGEHPTPETLVIANATIWTSSDRGILEDAWMVVRNGAIEALGTGAPPAVDGARRIDATGKHVTPGLIDAHSHTGLFQLGVNEGTQAVTSEVRIEDALDPGHINWYRQLAGGVTVANLLHGSANPIGGQSRTVKIRWGAVTTGDMFMEGAKPGIKFALGENVKQSNWGERFTTRYPQTRLGVETIFRDRFHAARAYAERGMQTASGRRDLELEALAEVLAGERLVHCHSYRQDEIVMLCNVAKDFGFKIGTFQHGLETYKVAEIVREHAIGASIFSDWWAFKFEVVDAIAYAGPINHEVGLLTSFNSDSDELARRMNLEAAKALKYARQSGIELSPQQALDFVTINPAIQLGIADRVGSLEPGKDADFVIWSGDPLSAFSRCEATWIDGAEYFSLDKDRAHRDFIASERTRLIQKAIASKDARDDDAGTGETETPAGEPIVDSPPTRYFEMLHRGLHSGMHPGDCGCAILNLEHID